MSNPSSHYFWEGGRTQEIGDFKFTVIMKKRNRLHVYLIAIVCYSDFPFKLQTIVASYCLAISQTSGTRDVRTNQHRTTGVGHMITR